MICPLSKSVYWVSVGFLKSILTFISTKGIVYLPVSTQVGLRFLAEDSSLTHWKNCETAILQVLLSRVSLCCFFLIKKTGAYLNRNYIPQVLDVNTYWWLKSTNVADLGFHCAKFCVIYWDASYKELVVKN